RGAMPPSLPTTDLGACSNPCKSVFAASAIVGTAVADERPVLSWAVKPDGERGSSSAVPLNPNSRKGRKRSPVLQGRETMDARFVGIDVSKDKLDVHIRPGGETFVVSRDAEGLDELIKRLKPVHAVGIGVEATGGFEQVVAATVAGVGLPV